VILVGDFRARRASFYGLIKLGDGVVNLVTLKDDFNKQRARRAVGNILARPKLIL
jgi:hypothetical protein